MFVDLAAPRILEEGSDPQSVEKVTETPTGDAPTHLNVTETMLIC